MKRRSGLHKKVSSIFGESSLPPNPSPDSSTETPKGGTGVTDPAGGQPSLHYAPGAGRTSHSTAKVAPALTEDQEYAASQRKKLFLMLGLGVVLVLVLFCNFYKPGPGNTNAGAETTSSLSAAARDIEIHWPQPEVWPDNIRDPMVFKASAARLYAVESKIEGPFALRGIVYQPQGRSQALVGTEILYEGDEIDGWTVKAILQDSVRLEKADGEKLELKMEDR